MSNLERKVAFADVPGAEIKAAGVDVEERIVTGYASVSAVLDRHGDIIVPGASKASLKSLVPKFMWQHRDALGVSRSHAEDAKGIAVSGYVSRTTAGDDALTLMADGAVDSFSIGYRATDVAFLSTADADEFAKMLAGLGLDKAQSARLKSSLAGGRLAKVAPYGVRLIKAMDVVEYSAVTVPANPWATIDGGRKSFADLCLPIADGLADGDVVDPSKALANDPDVAPSLIKAAFLLPESKGIPLVEMVDGVPMHTRRAIRAAIVAVKDGALRDHGLSDGDALDVLNRLAERAGVAINAPSVKSAPATPDYSLLRSLVSEQKRADSLNRAASVLRTITTEIA